MNCPLLESQLQQEGAQEEFQNLKKEVKGLFSKGGTVLLQVDSAEQSVEDPQLNLVLGNSWFSMNLLDPELLKSQVKYEQKTKFSSSKTRFIYYSF
jgi:hypothetical protein